MSHRSIKKSGHPLNNSLFQKVDLRHNQKSIAIGTLSPTHELDITPKPTQDTNKNIWIGKWLVILSILPFLYFGENKHTPFSKLKYIHH
jgi:hypothetical protein